MNTDEWTITSPDGRQWTGKSPGAAAIAATRATRDPVEFMERIDAMVEEGRAEDEAMKSEAYAKGFADATQAALIDEMVAALQGVIRVADRKTVEFDAARAVLAKAIGDAA